MDTGTHLVVGIGLGGLAMTDPAIASDATASAAVMIGTVLGSQAPDADTIMRMKGNAAYIRHHRGISHSIPFLFIWTGSISLVLSAIFSSVPFWHLVFWVFLAVFVHIFSDLFNTYGTQALRPISERWISWNIIHIFDLFIFSSHLVAILLWVLGVLSASIVFPLLYGIILLYYLWRTLHRARLIRLMPSIDSTHEPDDQYLLIPTIRHSLWHVVKIKKNGSYIQGEWNQGRLKWIDKVQCADHPAVEASKHHPNIASFLYFTSYACAEIRQHPRGYEVRWIDVRYRHRNKYPFVGVVIMDHDYRFLDSYVGWKSNEKIKKKLRFNA
ncbi:metal-dependent hydrolase [Marinicrinis lubricantis]|uniref:Metal-dependent hydrolase n=1 Tax=Marinicrinis lubricantis TaxID=2086470 RepID=A0ABW1IRP9_9BACL